MGKRIFDVIVGGLAFLILLPLLGIVALAVWTRLGTPVLFRQIRPGRNGHPFVILKFRTMTEDRDGDGNLLPDKLRLTRLGRFLRTTSLDELPELINVIKGDMSLVGPRPLLMRYLPYYTDRESLRHAVRPGITGWAQVNGRNLTDWNTRLAMDVWYVENWSFRLDLAILAKTVGSVVKRKGAAADTASVETDLDHERQQALDDLTERK